MRLTAQNSEKRCQTSDFRERAENSWFERPRKELHHFPEAFPMDIIVPLRQPSDPYHGIVWMSFSISQIASLLELGQFALK
jgi:hypothetical protein